MSFQIEVSVAELAQRKLFLATPCYAGACHGLFARSLMDLSALCARYNIPLQVYFLFNESLITRARNYAVDEFLRSGADHLMFIDSDIGFNANDVLALMAMQYKKPEEYDVIGGAYPKKCISWEKIKLAVDKGFADENPNNLEKFVGDYVFNPKSETGSIPIGEPAEVRELGTGFMMITRRTLEVYKEAYPDIMYLPDHVRTDHFDGTREIGMYFQAEIEPGSKRYLSEDYNFCYKTQQAGLKIWLCPWMKLQHAGSMIFGGSLGDLAAIGANATADINELKKGKR